MVKGKLKIIIDNQAKHALREAYNYIKKDSLQNAEKVKSKMRASINDLIKNPEKYAPDKYRFDNDTSYRDLKFTNTGLPTTYLRKKSGLSGYAIPK